MRPEVARGGSDVHGGLLEIVHPAPSLSGAELRDAWDARLHAHAGEQGAAAYGVWRFGEVALPVTLDQVVSHPEGNTPLLERAAIARWTGIERIAAKHEGHNPTGSFKDRGMTVAVAHARGVGAAGLVCASTGNTASSLASYAAHAGIPAVVLVPAGEVATGKLPQALAYGAHAARAGRLRRLPAPRSRSQPAAGALPRELAEPVPAGRAEDHRDRTAATAELDGARLDSAPRRQPGEHCGLRQSAA